jgi:hypothetical protein
MDLSDQSGKQINIAHCVDSKTALFHAKAFRSKKSQNLLIAFSVLIAI